MEYDAQIRSLAGETIAIQRLLIALLSRMAASDVALSGIVSASFDEAARVLEDMTIKLGASVPPEHLAHSVRVVEDMRTATLGNHQKPKHLI
jgi:hypothetical protein